MINIKLDNGNIEILNGVSLIFLYYNIKKSYKFIIF